MVREPDRHVADMDDFHPEQPRSTRNRNNNENHMNTTSSVVASSSDQRNLEHNVNVPCEAGLSVGSKRQAENNGRTTGKVRKMGEENSKLSPASTKEITQFFEILPKIPPKDKVTTLNILLNDKSCEQVIQHVVNVLVSKSLSDKKIHPSDAAFNDVLNTCRVIETHFKKWVIFSNNIQNQMKDHSSLLNSKDAAPSGNLPAPAKPLDDPSLDSNHDDKVTTDNNATPSFPKPSSQLTTPPPPQGAGDDSPQAVEDVSSNETEKLKKKIVAKSKQPVVVIETSALAEQAIRQATEQAFKSKEVSAAPAATEQAFQSKEVSAAPAAISSSKPDEPTIASTTEPQVSNQEIPMEIESPACPEVVDEYAEYEQSDVSAMAADATNAANFQHWQPKLKKIADRKKEKQAPANITPSVAKNNNNDDDSAAPKTAHPHGNEKTPQNAEVPEPTEVLKKEPTPKKPENNSSNGTEPASLAQKVQVEVVDLTLDSDEDEPPTHPTTPQQQPPKPIGGVETRRRVDAPHSTIRGRTPTRASVNRNVMPANGNNIILVPRNTEIIIPPGVSVTSRNNAGVQQPQCLTKQTNQRIIAPNSVIHRNHPALPRTRIKDDYQKNLIPLPPKMLLKFDSEKKNALQFSMPEGTATDALKSVETYELWACNSMTSKWVNVGQPIEALELPVVCTMNMSKNSGKVYFYVVRGRDKNGQPGPFSNVLCSLDWDC